MVGLFLVAAGATVAAIPAALALGSGRTRMLRARRESAAGRRRPATGAGSAAAGAAPITTPATSADLPEDDGDATDEAPPIAL